MSLVDVADELGTEEDEYDDEQQPSLVFGSTEQWVTEFLLPTYVRYVTPNGQILTWCPSWWEHAEAIQRLEALWRAWEYLRLDSPLGMSIWWKDHADHHLPALLDPHGTFRGCTTQSGHQGDAEQLPTSPAPLGFFPDERDDTELPDPANTVEDGDES